MIIKLSPVRMDAKLTARVSGDILFVNGDPLDFSLLPEGGVLPSGAIISDWVAGDVCRENGEICLVLRLPHGPFAPHETRFPDAFYEPMTVTDGPVPLPPYDAPPADDVKLPEPESEVMP